MDISENNPRFGQFQNVKRKFFALRNGIVADTLRKGGSAHRIIFGLTLPQIKEIADATGTDSALAKVLWDNDSTRESRLLAPMIMASADFPPEEARRWIGSIRDIEEADILCHRLLRRLDYAESLIDENISSDSALTRYTALRLMFNLLVGHERKALQLALAEKERNDSLTLPIAVALESEARFMLGE